MKRKHIWLLLIITGCLLWGTGCKKNPAEPEPDPVPASMEIVSGQDQSAPGGTLLDEPLVVQMSDQTGAGLAGLNVSWSVAAGNGTVSPASGETDSDGMAQAEWTLGMARENAVSVSVTGLDPLEFRATGISPCEEPVPLPATGATGPVPVFLLEYQNPDPNDPFQLPFGISYGIGVDIGEDGIDDLVIINSTDNQDAGAVFVFRNDGAGNLTRDSLEIPTDDIHAPRASEVIDSDNNGLDDILVADFGIDWEPFSGQRNLLLVQNGGSFEERGTIDLTDKNTLTHTVTTGDINCDGHPDIFEGNIPSTTTPEFSHLWINSGGGSFTIEDERLPEHGYTGFPLAPWASTISAEFCDVNSDGAADLLVLGDTWSLLLNDGFGNFSEAPDGNIPEAPDTGEFASDIGAFCADADLDGHPDLLVGLTDLSGTEFEPSLRLWVNDGDGNFADETDERLNQTWSEPGGASGILVRDFNEDSWPDFLVLREKCALFLNQGNAQFAQYEEEVFQMDPDIAGGCGGLVPMDLDGDEIIELVRVLGSDPMSVFRRQ